MKKLLLIPFLFILLPSVLAAPQFFESLPTNNTYTFGRDTDVFSINISDANLNTASVVLFIRVFESGSTWYSNATPSCALSTTWICSATISGFGSLAADGNRFILHWNASNTTGDTNSSENYFVVVDRFPPKITFTNPTNGSWVSGNQTIKMNVVDPYSGINHSSVQYSFDNSTFLNTNYSTGLYISLTDWNTRTYSNNQSVTIYARAKDNTTNENYSYANVTVDNELPTLIINKPGDTLNGSSSFEINVLDAYSGIENSTVKYTIGSESGSMNCTGNIYNFVCNYAFNSILLNDGNYTLTFSASDKTGNIRQNNTSVIVDNNAPILSIISPSDGSYVHGTTTISATAEDAGKGVSKVNLTIDGSAVEFSCSGTTNNKTCTYGWNTATTTAGAHVIVVNSTDLLNHSSEKTVRVYVDNAKPNITINSPTQTYLKGLVNFSVSVADDVSVDKNNVSYKLNNTTTIMSCSEIVSGKSFVCNSTFNSSSFSDGSYTLQFFVRDGAGNEQTQSMNVKTDNSPPQIGAVSVSPITSKTPANFKISTSISDVGSDVASSKAKINYPDGKFIEVSLKKGAGSSWEYSFYSDSQGKHTIDITATDSNGNSANLTNTSQFFVGSLNCGNGVCDIDENYCFCSVDCKAPTCKENETVSCDSGIPTCTQKPVCGNGKCEQGESCSNCEKDCGACSKVNQTNVNETNKTGSILDQIIGGALGGSSNYLMIIILGIGVVAVVSFFIFKFTRPKKVYPGFKPKESPQI